MQSTLVGHSGREYKRIQVLHSHPKKSGLDIYLATSDSQFFILKPVSPSIFDHLHDFNKEFGDNSYLRTHVDYNDDEKIIVYEGFTTDALSLVKNYPPLPLEVRKAILRDVGHGLRDMHCFYIITGVEWLHADFATLEAEPESVILFKLLSAFGPLQDGLVKHVNDAESGELLKGLWQAISEDESNETFDSWSSDMFPSLSSETKRLILRMTSLDPMKRASISDIMTDTYWNLKGVE